MCDVIAMSVEEDVDGDLCLSNVLLSVLPAFNQVDHVPCLADYCSTMLKAWLVVVLRKLVPVWIRLQVRQCLVPQGLLPLAG